MKSCNQDFYRLFHEIADLMALRNENAFKIRAYREAAETLKHSSPITKRDTDLNAFKAIDGIGDAIAGKMIEYIKTGRIDFLEKLRAGIPKAVREMLKIPGLGPKRVRQLHLNLGIQTRADLIRKVKDGSVDALPGFGPRLTVQILEAIQQKRKKGGRHPRESVQGVANRLIAALKKIQGIKKAVAAGSFRREATDVGDLDILAVGAQNFVPQTVQIKIAKLFPGHQLIASGETKISFVICARQLQVDIRFVGPESWGAALLYFTGSKKYNIMMRKQAISKGWTLNEYGLFDTKTGEQVAGRTEKEVYQALGLSYRKPRNRK